MARHFQDKVFSKEIILDGPLGKTKYYSISIEFLLKGNPHVDLFIQVFNARNIKEKTVFAGPFE